MALQKTMTVSGCFFLLGAGLQAGANNLTQLIVGRSILGFGVGAPLLLLQHASVNPQLLLCQRKRAHCAQRLCTRLPGARTHGVTT
jgi:hypothetical protein